MKRLMTVIDSHTGGEPTRTIVQGAPDLGSGTLAEKKKIFESRFDYYRTALINEPRGSDAMVGALLCEPTDPESAAAVLFFNNVGYLGMCGHGAIGVATTLHYLGIIQPGRHRLETLVGTVDIELHNANQVSINNVHSYRYAKNISVDLDEIGTVTGDIAWGGNWFFLINDHQQKLCLSRTTELLDYTWKIRKALEKQNITGANNGLIDHIELFSEPDDIQIADSKNFVLCPGRAYDRSPCGTGTSAKLACLFEDGKLEQGEQWRQQSITGSVFTGSVSHRNNQLIPTITGNAYINMKSDIFIDENDPFRYGVATNLPFNN